MRSWTVYTISNQHPFGQYCICNIKILYNTAVVICNLVNIFDANFFRVIYTKNVKIGENLALEDLEVINKCEYTYLACLFLYNFCGPEGTGSGLSLTNNLGCLEFCRLLDTLLGNCLSMSIYNYPESFSK